MRRLREALVFRRRRRRMLGFVREWFDHSPLDPSKYEEAALENFTLRALLSDQTDRVKRYRTRMEAAAEQMEKLSSPQYPVMWTEFQGALFETAKELRRVW